VRYLAPQPSLQRDFNEYIASLLPERYLPQVILRGAEVREGIFVYNKYN
jgi:hypothetical protein